MKILFFFIGGCFGSLLNVICYRTLRNEDFIWGRSRCDNCGSKLSFLDMIPVISWLMLKGKCRKCKNQISIRYPLTELFTGTVTALFYDKNNYIYICYWTYVMILVLISLFDLEKMEYPAVLSYILVTVGIISRLHNDTDMFSGILGIMTIIPVLIINRFKDVMGEGDIIILAVTGWMLGYERLCRAVLPACLCGLFYVLITGRKMIPFCPFLTIGITLCLL